MNRSSNELEGCIDSRMKVEKQADGSYLATPEFGKAAPARGRDEQEAITLARMNIQKAVAEGSF